MITITDKLVNSLHPTITIQRGSLWIEYQIIYKQKTKFSLIWLQEMYENSKENMETDTYPPSTISSTIDTTPSKLSISALFSTFFLSIWLIAS